MSNQITIGSCFAGIGGFELGLERGIPNSKTVWQIEQNKYCQTILQKHWPDATIYDDIREIDYDKIQTVDIICGGFPCQDISAAGKGKGIEHGDRSGLWRQMHRLINHLQPRVAVLENVPALLWKNRGMHIVLQDLASIGYDAEWCTISARQFGAPHLRKRVFIVAYPNRTTKKQFRTETKIDRFSKTKLTNVHEKNLQQDRKKNIISENIQHRGRDPLLLEPSHTNSKRRDSRKHLEREYKNNLDKKRNPQKNNEQRCKRLSRTGSVCKTATNPMCTTCKKQPSRAIQLETQKQFKRRCSKDDGIQQRDHHNYWQRFPTQPSLCHRDDGVPDRLARLRALGNAIVPQCSEYIGKKIYESNLLDYKF